MDLGQVNAEDTVQRCPDIERRGADLLGFGAWARQLTWVMCSICSQCRQRRLKATITFQHLALIEVIKLQRLGQRKDVLGPIIPIERGFDRLS